MVPISTIVLVIIALISITLIWSEKKAFTEVSNKVTAIADEVGSKQNDAMHRIEKEQVQSANDSLTIKGESMLKFVAGISTLPMTTFDFTTLNYYCLSLSSDPDILLAYIKWADGEFLTTFRNEKDEKLLSIVENVENLSLQQITETLIQHENVISLEKEISSNGIIHGKLFLLLSKEKILTQAANIKSDFNTMSSELNDYFVQLGQDVNSELKSSTKRSVLQSIIASFVGVLLLTFSVAFLIDKLVIKPAVKVMNIIDEMKKGRLSEKLNLNQTDEIGRMGNSIDAFCDNLNENVISTIKKLAEGDLNFKVTPFDEKDEIGNALQKMSQNLTTTIQQIQENAQVLTRSSENISAISTQLAAGAEESSSQATNVAASTEQINLSSHDISQTAEQMSENMTKLTEVTEKISSEVKEIGNKANMGSKVSNNALTTVNNASATISALQESAEEIDITTATIEEITDQTKLLALNATIEAARAGDAGKGFAVVAGEVKELAKQSADAAETISALIKGVQNKTEETARAIIEVQGVIKQLNQSSEIITTAVNNHSNETQNMMTIMVSSREGATEVTENILSLSKGANEVASNIQGVSSGMNESSRGIRQVSESAEELATLAMQLNNLVGGFTLGQATS